MLTSLTWLNESNGWEDMVIDACSDFEHANPSGLDKLIAADPDTIMDDETLQELYNDAAKCLVEPEVATGNHDVDLSSYHDRTEKEGFDFVMSIIREMPSGDKWAKVIKLVNEIGY